MKNLEKYLPCSIVNIFLILLLIIFGIISFIKGYILSGDAFFDALKSKDVYSKVYNSLDVYYQEQYNSTGIPKEVYLNAIDLNEIETITNDITYHGVNYICGNPNNLIVTYNFDDLENSINTFFDDYATSINYVKDDNYYSKVNNVTQNAIDKITSECDVFNWNTLKNSGVLDTLSKYVSYLKYVQVITGILIIGLLVLLIVFNGKHYIFDNIYWIGLSLSVSSVIMLIPCIYLKSTDYFYSFSVKSEIIFNSVTGFLIAVLEKFTSMCVISLCFGAVLFLVGFILNFLRKKH